MYFSTPVSYTHLDVYKRQLQALGRPFLSMGLSLLRDFVISVPLVLILPRYLGITGPLYSAPAADILSFIAVLLIMPRVLNFKEGTKEETSDKSWKPNHSIAKSIEA